MSPRGSGDEHKGLGLNMLRLRTVNEWNEGLFAHFFSVADEDDAPVTRLVVTPEELQHAVGDDTNAQNAVREAFLETMRERLKTEHKSLCVDALALALQRHL
jgi:hypothetical protein